MTSDLHVQNREGQLEKKRKHIKAVIVSFLIH